MISVPMIALSCICIILGRLSIRCARGAQVGACSALRVGLGGAGGGIPADDFGRAAVVRTAASWPAEPIAGLGPAFHRVHSCSFAVGLPAPAASAKP